MQFECCGASNYTDFRVNATKWNATVTYSGYSFNASVPVMCCTMKDHTLFPGQIADIEFVDLKGCLASSYPNATNQMVRDAYWSARVDSCEGLLQRGDFTVKEHRSSRG